MKHSFFGIKGIELDSFLRIKQMLYHDYFVEIFRKKVILVLEVKKKMYCVFFLFLHSKRLFLPGACFLNGTTNNDLT